MKEKELALQPYRWRYSLLFGGATTVSAYDNLWLQPIALRPISPGDPELVKKNPYLADPEGGLAHSRATSGAALANHRGIRWLGARNGLA